MTLNEKITLKCSDDKTRTGQVCYIHPDGIFYVLQFKGFRETFYFDRAGAEEKYNPRKASGYHAHKGRKK